MSIKKEYIKKLTNTKNGNVYYYVDWGWAKSHPFFSKYIVTDESHPNHKNYKKLNLEKINVI